MSDILKEAIADAKAVRETALQNAKMALEEAFTPQLKSMLSAKLKEDEYEDDDDLEQGGEEEGEEDPFAGEEDIPAEEGSYHEDDEASGEEDPFAGEEEPEPEVEEEGIIEINGVKYAPVVSEEDEEEFGGEEEEEEGDLDLEAVIRELESEISEGDDDDDDDDNIAKSRKFSDSVEETKDDESVEESKDEIEEEFEIDENIFSEGDDEDEDEDEEDVEESNTSELESELKEYKEAVVFLKDKLHEVNILNAKLLFTNKLFREYSLDNNQKLKVVENFDRAQTTREIKLVYTTLAEQLNDNSKIIRKTKHITESASSAIGSTKPSKESRKVITEEQQVANRFKKLAGLL